MRGRQISGEKDRPGMHIVGEECEQRSRQVFFIGLPKESSMKPDYQTILYATDLSDNSAAALRHAMTVAERFDARVTILHVMPEMDASIVGYVATVIGEDRMAELELEHEKELQETIREKVAGFVKNELGGEKDLRRIADIEVHHGNPVVEILKAADRTDADLLVIGSHGKGRLQYAFLGSVAEKLLNKSTRPILVVPLIESSGS